MTTDSMPNPERQSEILSAYLDGELSPAEKAAVERVLKQNANARHVLDELRKTVQAVQRLPRQAAPPAILEEIRNRLERGALLDEVTAARPRGGSFVRLGLKGLAAAAMVGLLAWSGWWVWDSNLGSRRPRKDDRFSTVLRPTDLRAIPTRAPVEGALLRREGMGELGALSFTTEPVHVRVALKDRTERDIRFDALMSELQRRELSDLDAFPNVSADAQSKPTDSPSWIGEKRGYLAGRPGVHFENPEERQVLIRGTPAEIDELLTRIGASPLRPSEVSILEESESDDGLGFFSGLFRAMGIDGALSLVEGRAVPEKETPPSKADREQPQSLVARRLQELERRTQPASPSSTPVPPASPAVSALAEQLPTAPASADSPAGVVPAPRRAGLKAESLITVVIEFVLDEPPPSSAPPRSPVSKNDSRLPMAPK